MEKRINAYLVRKDIAFGGEVIVRVLASSEKEVEYKEGEL